MTDLILNFGGQRQLALQRGRAHDPFALGQHTHQLAIGVHLNEAEQRGAVLLGHPVGRLDFATARDMREESFVASGVGFLYDGHLLFSATKDQRRRTNRLSMRTQRALRQLGLSSFVLGRQYRSSSSIFSRISSAVGITLDMSAAL